MIRPRAGASLAAQFAEVARARADTVAVLHGSERISYAELDRRSAALAATLAAATDPEELVGICLPPGIDAVLAIVAAARAGRAYVPLDPRYPRERLRYMVDDARLAVVIAGDDAPEVVTRQAIPIDPVDPGLAGEPPAMLPAPSTATPLYVIYTSGSTGRPKGVAISHGNVAALLAASGGIFGFGAADTWTLFHSISFDFSVWELWGALLHGARLVVVDEETRLAPDRLLALLERAGVTVFNVVPSVFRDIAVEHGRRPRSLSLRYLIFGGEPVHLPSVAAFREACADPPRVVNMYGITETTVHVTARFLDDEPACGTSPIGVPLPHLEVVLVDSVDGALRPVPPGAVGELCVAGAGLSAGYLRCPRLTAERFVWLERAGTRRRFYRSGDLARWRAGELEYLGRTDHQVKIRGFRIELGEIEASLEALPEVAASAVVVEPNRVGEPVLVGHVVPHRPEHVGDRRFARGLRAALAGVLPAHMVPGRLVPVAALPRTPSGKLDRARLGTGPVDTNELPAGVAHGR
jgi:amino acid adenylation domain-containing protein